MNNFERNFWRGLFSILAALLLPFSVALSLVAVLFTWGAFRMWKLVSRIATFGGWKK